MSIVQALAIFTSSGNQSGQKILLKKMDQIAQKMGEVNGDLKTAIEATKQGITTSKSPYAG